MINFIKAIGDKCYLIANKLEVLDTKLLKYCGICLCAGVVIGYLLK